MNYKLLLLGDNESAKNDFFSQTESYFELQTTSMHFNDIKSHMKYFEPDGIVYCMNGESTKLITNMMALKQKAVGTQTPFIVLGNQEDINRCLEVSEDFVDLQLVRPITVGAMRTNIIAFFEAREMREKKLMEEVEKSFANEGVNETGEAALVGDSSLRTARTGDMASILVVDDDISMIKVIKKYLEEDYKVASAVNGKIALRYLEKNTADLILLDYVMPGMDGPEVLEQLRSNPDTVDIPVVFLTGASERDMIAKALSMKPQGYILKPVERQQLMEKIAEILG